MQAGTRHDAPAWRAGLYLTVGKRRYAQPQWPPRSAQSSLQTSRKREHALCFTPHASWPWQLPTPSLRGGARPEPTAMGSWLILAHEPARRHAALLQVVPTVDSEKAGWLSSGLSCIPRLRRFAVNARCGLACTAAQLQSSRRNYPGENPARLSHSANKTCSVPRFGTKPSCAPACTAAHSRRQVILDRGGGVCRRHPLPSWFAGLNLSSRAALNERLPNGRGAATGEDAPGWPPCPGAAGATGLHG